MNRVFAITKDYLIWAFGAMAASTVLFTLISVSVHYKYGFLFVLLLVLVLTAITGYFSPGSINRLSPFQVQQAFFRKFPTKSDSQLISVGRSHNQIFISYSHHDRNDALRILSSNANRILLDLSPDFWITLAKPTSAPQHWIGKTGTSPAFDWKLPQPKWTNSDDAEIYKFIDQNLVALIGRIRDRQDDLRSIGIEHVHLQCDGVMDALLKKGQIFLIISCKNEIGHLSKLDMFRCREDLGEIVGIPTRQSSVRLIRGPVPQTEGKEIIGAF
jgi:hypothetical protein